MKKFLIKVGILAACLMIIAVGMLSFGMFVMGAQYAEGYNASAIDKLNRLNSIDGPKIILAGNSNLAFGIDSELLEEEMGMPVVNLGLHGDMGNAFHEEMAKIGVSEGDIVVVCHTNYADDDTFQVPTLAWVTAEYNEEVWQAIRKTDYLSMATSYLNYFVDAFKLWATGAGNKDSGTCYSRSAFNEYGDVEYKPESGRNSYDELIDMRVTMPQVNDVCTKRLNNLNQYVGEQGGKMVVVGYPLLDNNHALSRSDITGFEDELQESLDCDVISDFTDYYYDPSYFYDTAFHLTNDGAQVRTLQLADDLKNWMTEQG